MYKQIIIKSFQWISAYTCAIHQRCKAEQFKKFSSESFHDTLKICLKVFEIKSFVTFYYLPISDGYCS